MTGLTSSDTFPVSASKVVIKEIKGKEVNFPNRDIVDLTMDSPLKKGKRSALSTDGLSAESLEFSAFKMRHCRTSHTHMPHTMPCQRNLHQMPSEAEIPVSSRDWLNRVKAASLQSEADDVLGDALLNAGSLGSSSSGSKDTIRLLSKNKCILAHAVESHGREGEPSVATVLDCQMMGRISSEPEGLLPFKRKRSSPIDPAKSHQRFRPPQIVSGHSARGSFFGGMQRPIEVDDWESTRSHQRYRPPRIVSGHSARGSSFGGMQRPIEVDDWESTRSSGVNMDFQVPETARQTEQDEMLAKFLQDEYILEVEQDENSLEVEQDEMLAKFLQDEHSLEVEQDDMLAKVLQDEYSLEAGGGSPSLDDAQLAQMLQEEENMKSLRQIAQPSFHDDDAQLARMLQEEENTKSLRQIAQSSFHDRVEFLASMEEADSQGSFPMSAEVDHDFNENDYETLLALDDTDHARNGVSYDRIEQLPVSVIKPTDVYEDTCSICLETPVVGDVVRRLPCMHGFHQQCIDAWLEQQANCPICKVTF